MYNPKKVWLLYAKQLFELLNRSVAEVQTLVRKNLEAVSTDLGLNLDAEQKERLAGIAMAFFHEEYLGAYRPASQGEEPDNELTAAQSCVIVEETTGYPVTALFKKMRQEILDCRDKPEEEVADILIRTFGAYPAQAILETDLKSQPIPENNLPDFCLALSVKAIIERKLGVQNK
jgi:hypothetical protein